MRKRLISKIFLTFIIISLGLAATGSSNILIVLAEPATLEDIIAEIEELNNRIYNFEENVTAMNSAIISLSNAFDNVEGFLYSLSATTATTTEIAIMVSALEKLNDMTNSLKTTVESLNATTASELELSAISSTVDELGITLGEFEVTLDSLSKSAATSDDLETTKNELTTDIDGLKTDIENLRTNIEDLKIMVIVTITLALVATVTGISTVFIILRKTKTSN